MRLTLRTLLAFLDNTLEPQDAEILRSKLAESGFATQLVQRIRATLANAELAAPSPDAVGPVEEANVISEYLDSTLPAEQVAEIERACLESDPHLAEAAACHQILTMVLGRKAEVAQELRQRIYDLPEKNVEEIAAASGSFSAVVIPPQSPIGSLEDVVPTADTEPPAGSPVQPVGKGDSGVADAPTRIRQTAVGEDTESDRGEMVPAIAGSTARLDRDTRDIYGGQIRTSRIAPWLVSLALVAVLLFALVRIFAPLLSDDAKLASLDEQSETSDAIGEKDSDEAGVDDIMIDDAAPPLPIGNQANAEPDVENEIMVDDQAPPLPGFPETTELVPPGEAEIATLPAADPEQDAEPQAATGTASLPSPELLPAPDAVSDLSPAVEPAEANTVAPAVGVAEVAELPETPDPEMVAETAESSEADVTSDAGEPLVGANPSGGDGDEEKVVTEIPLLDPADGDPAASPEPEQPPAAEVATVVSDNTLVLTTIGSGEDARFARLRQGMPVVEGHPVMVAPTFRATLESLANVTITAVGPTRLRLAVVDDRLTTHLEYGRILLSGTEPDVRLTLMMAGNPIDLTLSDVDSRVAASVQYVRAPGKDPLVDENRVPVIGVLSVAGTTSIDSGSGDQQLAAGQQWIQRGSSQPQESTLQSIPDWIDPLDPDASTLEASARQGLLAQLEGEDPLPLALREATEFRQAEVVALAARTLLQMGLPDVYFGGDGVLSESKQRTYWSEHFAALINAIDRNAALAEAVQESVQKMDSANAEAIMSLLTGYSQERLKAGGDAELVELLDSPSMSVRVLALENLRRITGTTLYFRAEQDNAIRREPGIKKWEVRQRKGDIRWSE